MSTTWASRSLVREYALATAPTFINDVVVTNKAAYFTDSQKALSGYDRVVRERPPGRRDHDPAQR